MDKSAVIPKIIHQTWKTKNIPTDHGDPDSWKRLNPDWEYKLWTDTDMLSFMEREFPELVTLYLGYPQNIQRADLFRYCVIWKEGGIYADIDTDCCSSLTPLERESRIVVCEEPRSHGETGEVPRGQLPLHFNGVFASPSGHPFWPFLINKLKRVSRRVVQNFVLDSTGPFIFTAALETYPDQTQIAYHSSHLFNPFDSQGVLDRSAKFGDHCDRTISRHNWAGSWFRKGLPDPILDIRNKFHEYRADVIRSWEKPPHYWSRRIDHKRLQADLPNTSQKPNIVILVPVKNTAKHLEQHWSLLENLDYPRDRLRLVYVEGGSTDGSFEKLSSYAKENPLGLKEVRAFSGAPYFATSRENRSKRRFQLKRRSMIAAARNMALDLGLNEDDDWVLWLDADVIEAPSDILQTLLAQRAKIVTPNCVRNYNGPSFDMNAFFNRKGDGNDFHPRRITCRLSQPPKNTPLRLHLSDLNYLDRVELSAVGGTMLLVDANIHRAGLVFPEEPYRFLIETEAFGRIAKDLGVSPIGLPNVEILHAKD